MITQKEWRIIFVLLHDSYYIVTALADAISIYVKQSGNTVTSSASNNSGLHPSVNDSFQPMTGQITPTNSNNISQPATIERRNDYSASGKRIFVHVYI